MDNCLVNLNLIEFDNAAEQELAAFAKAIAHPARVRLLKILVSGQCLGTDLVEQLDLAQSTISEHLRVLKQAGLVHAEVRHPRTCFSINPEAMGRMRSVLTYLS